MLNLGHPLVSKILPTQKRLARKGTYGPGCTATTGHLTLPSGVNGSTLHEPHDTHTGNISYEFQLSVLLPQVSSSQKSSRNPVPLDVTGVVNGVETDERRHRHRPRALTTALERSQPRDSTAFGEQLSQALRELQASSQTDSPPVLPPLTPPPSPPRCSQDFELSFIRRA